jgi:hypothetical protein
LSTSAGQGDAGTSARLRLPGKIVLGENYATWPQARNVA